MTTTETTSTSWFSRMGSSIKNIFFGIILVVGALILLFWNEGRAVRTEQSLAEGRSQVVSIPSTPLSPQNEGKLVHVTGPATVGSILADGDFGVSGSSLKMRRTVEMYQWKENAKSKTVEKLGGGTETTTTYTYTQEWSKALIDSSSFKESEQHQNPTTKPFMDKEWISSDAKLGAFTLSEAMISSLSGYTPLPITQEMVNVQNTTSAASLQLVGNTIYHLTPNITSPAIGSTRILYDSIPPQMISIIYKQSGSTFTPYQTKNGEAIQMIRLGKASSTEMFTDAEATNKTLTWILRFVGAILLFAGFQMILGVFRVVGSVVPFIGDIIGAGVGFASFLLALIVGSIDIAIAWVAYRPLVALMLIAIAVISYTTLVRRAKQ